MASKRDNKGRFMLGNSGGPGRPPRATEAGYLATMMRVIDLDQWQAICERARDDALNGDAKAREWIAKYLLGDPGTKAPAPMAVVIDQLLQRDPALTKAAARLAGPVIAREKYPILHPDDCAEDELQAEAERAILAAEQAAEQQAPIEAKNADH